MSEKALGTETFSFPDIELGEALSPEEIRKATRQLQDENTTVLGNYVSRN